MNDLDKLKKLLFGKEKDALDSIAERVERPETRMIDVADILPEAIHHSHQKNDELVDALTGPVGDCVQRAFHDDPETYGNALYPVIGPAIRKSIAQAMRSFSEQVNRAVEQSLTVKGLRWRLQAARAGVPFSDFVVQKNLLYRVEQAYLISRENGLLIDHVHHAESRIKDSDAVSAMFTAIQDFVKESFSPDRTGRLESADMGEFTLWAVHGPHALLVAVIRGTPPRELRTELSAILERIHFRHGDAVRHYSGDTSNMPEVDHELRQCLGLQQVRGASATKKRGLPWFWLIVALLAVGFFAYLLNARWQDAKQLEALAGALDDTPGIYIASAVRNGDSIVVRGMHDPVAPTVADVAVGVGVSAEQLIADMTPFYSLEPEIVQRRVQRLLAGVQDVRFSIEGEKLVLSGQATSDWVAEVSAKAYALPGISEVDVGALRFGNLEALERDVDALSGRRFMFESGVKLGLDEAAAFQAYASTLADLQVRAAEAGRALDVHLLAETDNTGSQSANEALRQRRAAVAAALLARVGIVARLDRPSGQPVVTRDQRSVSVYLALKESDGG